jgi:hypothetical protein
MNVDIIGNLYDLSNPDSPVLIPGYHVNTDTPIEGVQALDVKTPIRKFAGNNVVYCYKFNSKEEFEGINLGN